MKDPKKGQERPRTKILVSILPSSSVSSNGYVVLSLLKGSNSNFKVNEYASLDCWSLVVEMFVVID